MKKPTQEQIEEFWGWCEVGKINYSGNDDPHLLSDFRQDFPPMDLDNILKYAVPKLEGCSVSLNIAPSGDIFWNAKARSEGDSYYATTAGDPALALFWAIWEVKKNEIRD